jgi:DNA-binding response OmpR family regulator
MSTLLRIEPRRRLLWFGDKPILLSKREVILLSLLNQQPGQPCTHTQLSQAIYPDRVIASGEQLHALMSLVSRLRKKLERKTGSRIRIETLRGVGYRLEVEAEEGAGLETRDRL